MHIKEEKKQVTNKTSGTKMTSGFPLTLQKARRQWSKTLKI